MPEVSFTSSVKQLLIVRNQYRTLVIRIDRNFIVSGAG